MKKWSFVLLLLFPAISYGQDSLMNILEQETTYKVPANAEATFKGTRLINGHSVETRKKGVLDVLISHRFGRINSGSYNLFGLDNATIRIGADYGITDNLNIGLGRSSFEKTYDGFLKYKFLRQQDGEKSVPVSVAAFASMAIRTLKSSDPDVEINFNERLAYTAQILIARKFSSAFSLQLMPTLVHINQVTNPGEENDNIALGAGGRLKLTKRLSLNAEYYYRINQGTPDLFNDALAIGFDIETGGHVFQLHFTNAQSMIEKGFITETRDNFFDGDIHFGFNISRTFQLY